MKNDPKQNKNMLIVSQKRGQMVDIKQKGTISWRFFFVWRCRIVGIFLCSYVVVLALNVRHASKSYIIQIHQNPFPPSPPHSRISVFTFCPFKWKSMSNATFVLFAHLLQIKHGRNVKRKCRWHFVFSPQQTYSTNAHMLHFGLMPSTWYWW